MALQPVVEADRRGREGAVVAREGLEEVMEVVYSESRSAIGKQRKEVLRVAGLV